MSAFDAAVKLLKGRSKSVAALRAQLESKGHPPAEVAEAVERLRALHYLDDARHASARARGFYDEGRARADVVRRLEADGIDAALAAQVATAVADELGHEDATAAAALLQKRKLEGVKAARFLLARGFDDALVRRLCHLDGE